MHLLFLNFDFPVVFGKGGHTAGPWTNRVFTLLIQELSCRAPVISTDLSSSSLLVKLQWYVLKTVLKEMRCDISVDMVKLWNYLEPREGLQG